MLNRAMLVFDNSIKSEATRKAYHYALRKFCEWAKISSPEGLLQLKSEFLQEIVEDYLFWLKKQGYAVNSIKMRIAAVDLFLTINDKELRMKKIKKMYPEGAKLGGGGIWSNEEIKTMLEGANLRNKMIVHILCSSGVRIGGLVGLRLEDISDMDFGCKKIRIYAGTKDEYVSFVNAECSALLDTYVSKRRADGENVKGSSPLLRTEYRIGIEPVRSMSLNAVGLVLFRMVSKVRKKIKGKYVRYENAQGHSYRKRFITLCKQSENANISLIEKLAGHQGAVRLDGSYFKPDDNRLLGEYVKHMNTLMIDDSEREKAKREVLEKQVASLETEKDKVIAKQASDIKTLMESVEGIWELLGDGKG